MAPSAFGALAATSFVLSLGLCALIQRAARRLHLVDVPNERSLHTVPVPRLGGVAIVLGVAVSLTLGARWVGLLDARDTRAWLAGGAVIAILGLVDDLRPLPALIRLLIQLTVTALALSVPLGANAVNLCGGIWIHPPQILALPAAVVFVVGTTNIYNFMDGMDGLAATQTVGAALALGCCAIAAGQFDVALVAIVIAGGASGFFVHNSPPAKIFLGDAGSTFLGFTFGTLALLAATRPSPVPFAVVPTALAPFLLDGTFTILRRLRRGERVWKAHRSHLYQRAVATGLAHRDVLVVYAAWVATAAITAMLLSRWSAPSTLAAMVAMLLPLILVWRWVVRREQASIQVPSVS